MNGKPKVVVRPLTSDRWPDLESIFRARGCSVARMCWCMHYRRSGAQLSPPKGATRAGANRAELKALVDAGRPPGLIGYHGKTPVGWVSLGPREEFARLARSPVMKPVDDQPVWSVICFVVPAQYRGQGVAQALLAGAVDYARQQGARLVEAYPVDQRGRTNDENLWFGTWSMFDKAGFAEVARRKPRRPVVRLATFGRRRRAQARLLHTSGDRAGRTAHMVSSTAATVAEYLGSLPPERRKVVAAMRRFIRQHLPRGYREAMSVGMIAYEIPLVAYANTYNGKPLVYVALAAQKNGYSLYLTCAHLDETRRERLRKAWTAMGRRPDLGKSCLRFKSPEDLPLEAIAREIASTPPAELIRHYEAGRA